DALAASLDDLRNLLQGFERDQGAHLRVASLVSLHAGDRPQLREQSGAVGVDGQGELAWQCAETPGPCGAVHAVAVPLDLAVSAGDHGDPLGVELDAEPIRLGQCPELLDGALFSESATHESIAGAR